VGVAGWDVGDGRAGVGVAGLGVGGGGVNGDTSGMNAGVVVRAGPSVATGRAQAERMGRITIIKARPLRFIFESPDRR